MGITRLALGGGLLFMIVCTVASCGGKGGKNGDFPDDVLRRGDAAKIDYIMGKATPDSVARFICDAALGRVEGVRIDTFANATLRVYEKYSADDQVKFTNEFDSYIASQSLADRMRLTALAGLVDPQRLGYTMGLGYVQEIREKHKSVADIEKELAAFKKACGADADTYRRFLVGFHTALEIDHGRDLPEDVYRRFINYQ